QRRDGFFEMLKFGCPDNRRSDCWLMKHPGERDLRTRDATLFSHFPNAVYNSLIRFLRSGIKFLAVIIALTTLRADSRFPRAGETTSRQWTPRYYGDAFCQTQA